MDQRELDTIAKLDKVLAQQTAYEGDAETWHGDADTAIVEFLNQLGYWEIVSKWEAVHKWYA